MRMRPRSAPSQHGRRPARYRPEPPPTSYTWLVVPAVILVIWIIRCMSGSSSVMPAKAPEPEPEPRRYSGPTYFPGAGSVEGMQGQDNPSMRRLKKQQYRDGAHNFDDP